jgi:hypothetical protein
VQERERARAKAQNLRPKKDNESASKKNKKFACPALVLKQEKHRLIF